MRSLLFYNDSLAARGGSVAHVQVVVRRRARTGRLGGRLTLDLVQLAVLAEADEKRVDYHLFGIGGENAFEWRPTTGESKAQSFAAHLVDGQEAVRDEVGEDGGYQQRTPGVV